MTPRPSPGVRAAGSLGPPDLARQRAAFAERSRRYALRGFDRTTAAEIAVRLLDPVAGPVLDVGTGKGLLARALAARGGLVLSVDPDRAEGELAALLCAEAGVRDRVRFVGADAAELPFPDGLFRAAAAMDVLHHLDDPVPVLAEMARTLHPEGKLLLADFSRQGFELVAAVHREEGREHPESGVTLDDAIGCLAAAGFAVLERRSEHWHDLAVLARVATRSG